ELPPAKAAQPKTCERARRSAPALSCFALVLQLIRPCLARDLFRKPVPTFRDHALECAPAQQGHRPCPIPPSSTRASARRSHAWPTTGGSTLIPRRSILTSRSPRS